MKSKTIKRILSISAVCSIFSLVSIQQASAATLSKSASNNFTKAWELYATADSGKASLTYGYNTFLINEDYAWANHSTNKHYASLTNGNGSFSGPNKSGGTISKIEVTHSGSTVTYKCNY